MGKGLKEQRKPNGTEKNKVSYVAPDNKKQTKQTRMKRVKLRTKKQSTTNVPSKQQQQQQQFVERVLSKAGID